jgi:DNA-binding NarL/FixJ family response regulator
MPELNGLAATPLIKKVAPNSKVLIFSNHDNAGLVREAFSAGALGFISKSDLRAEIVSAVRRVNNNETFLGKSLERFKDAAPAAGCSLRKSCTELLSTVVFSSEYRI